MIIDFHVHPFSKEVTVKPNIEEAIKRQLEAHTDRAVAEAATQIFTSMFTQRSVRDILKEMKRPSEILNETQLTVKDSRTVEDTLRFLHMYGIVDCYSSSIVDRGQ